LLPIFGSTEEKQDGAIENGERQPNPQPSKKGTRTNHAHGPQE